MTGTVKWFNNQKGYGFISDAEGNDIFSLFRTCNGWIQISRRGPGC